MSPHYQLPYRLADDIKRAKVTFVEELVHVVPFSDITTTPVLSEGFSFL